jgi:hypothetical protein
MRYLFASQIVVLAITLSATQSFALDSVYVLPNPVYGNAYFQGYWHVTGNCWLVNHSTDTVWVNNAGVSISKGQGPVAPDDSVQVAFDLNTGEFHNEPNFSIDFWFGIPCLVHDTQTWIPIHFIYPSKSSVRRSDESFAGFYPNPFRQSIHVNPGLMGQEEITLYDSRGQLLTVLDPVNVIDLGWLANGSYFLRIANRLVPIIKTGF